MLHPSRLEASLRCAKQAIAVCREVERRARRTGERARARRRRARLERLAARLRLALRETQSPPAPAERWDLRRLLP